MNRKPARRSKTVAIIGTGLIGTSIALALRSRQRVPPQIVGWDPQRKALLAAHKRRALTRTAHSLADAVSGADTVVLAAPLDAVIALVPHVVAAAPSGALVMDVAGLKKPVVAAALKALRARPDILFASGHPLAGRERAGAVHAQADLFVGRPFLLTIPAQRRRTIAVAKVKARATAFARQLGAKPVLLTAKEHDDLIAVTSALPQLASIALALGVQRALAATGGKSVAGPGYADATRLAASPYHIWRPVLKASSPAVARALRHLTQALQEVENAARQPNDRAMERLFSRAAKARRRVAAG